MTGDDIRLPLGEAVVSYRGISYVNLERRGRGGTATVYRTIATNGPRRGVTFAVKLFKARSKEGWRVNFMREVHVLRDCDHPAIMKVFDEGMYLDQYPFVVMEYLPFTLADEMKETEILPIDKLNIVLHLLSALNYLARREPPVVHRDIKPPNIFMKEHSTLLGDFGLILQLGEERRAEGKKGGAEMAKMYRTPELVAYHNGGPPPPPVSDVFQLGLVATQLFTKINPLKHEAPWKPVKLNPIPKVPGKMGETVRRLLQQMLTIETDVRPRAADMLAQFQELYLAQHKRERTSAHTTTFSSSGPPMPAVDKDKPTPSRPEPSKKLPEAREHRFGEGIFDEEDTPP